MIGSPLGTPTATTPSPPEVCPVVMCSPTSSAGGDDDRAAPRDAAYTRTLMLASDRGPVLVFSPEKGGGQQRPPSDDSHILKRFAASLPGVAWHLDGVNAKH